MDTNFGPSRVMGKTASTTDGGMPPTTCGQTQSLQFSPTALLPTGIARSSLTVMPHVFRNAVLANRRQTQGASESW